MPRDTRSWEKTGTEFLSDTPGVWPWWHHHFIILASITVIEWISLLFQVIKFVLLFQLVLFKFVLLFLLYYVLKYLLYFCIQFVLLLQLEETYTSANQKYKNNTKFRPLGHLSFLIEVTSKLLRFLYSYNFYLFLDNILRVFIDSR